MELGGYFRRATGLVAERVLGSVLLTHLDHGRQVERVLATGGTPSPVRAGHGFELAASPALRMAAGRAPRLAPEAVLVPGYAHAARDRGFAGWMGVPLPVSAPRPVLALSVEIARPGVLDRRALERLTDVAEGLSDVVGLVEHEHGRAVLEVELRSLAPNAAAALRATRRPAPPLAGLLRAVGERVDDVHGTRIGVLEQVLLAEGAPRWLVVRHGSLNQRCVLPAPLAEVAPGRLWVPYDEAVAWGAPLGLGETLDAAREGELSAHFRVPWAGAASRPAWLREAPVAVPAADEL